MRGQGHLGPAASAGLPGRGGAVLSLLSTLFVGSGCNETEPFVIDASRIAEFAQERCKSVEDCCSSPSRGECEEEQSEILAALESEAGAPLEFSAECYEHMLEEARAAGCSNDVEACRLAHGKGRHGDTCTVVATSFYFADTCEEGLQCRVGRCVDDPFVALQLGGEGDACSPFDPCGDDLFCSNDAICREQQPVGATCEEIGECVGGNRTFCEFNDGASAGVCAEGRGQRRAV